LEKERARAKVRAQRDKISVETEMIDLTEKNLWHRVKKKLVKRSETPIKRAR
jgi:hypothetical protein